MDSISPETPITQKSPQPVVQPPVQSSAPVKPKNKLTTVLVIFIVLLSLGAAGFFTYQYIQLKQQTSITTFEECVKASGNMIQTIYPATCVTKDGRRFTQPITEEQQNQLPPDDTENIVEGESGQFCGGIAGKTCPEGYMCKLDGDYPDAGGICVQTVKTKTKYTCPANGWVDCMPGPDAKPECSTEAMTWYKANCPDFKGGAL